MSGLIPYEQLPDWVPGRVLLASDDLGWKNVALRAYHYRGQDVIVPAMRDFMLVSYRAGSTAMQRRFEGRWTRDTLGPGATSLLTRAQQAAWCWDREIEVTHVYLSAALVAEVASEVMDCRVTEVTLADVLRTEDPVMAGAVQAIATEAQTRGLGGALYVDALSRALVVHLLRRYAAIRLPEAAPRGGLTPRQERLIAEYIATHLAEALDLKALGAVLGLMPCLFSRLFRKSFGRPPHAYVMAARLDRARRLLAEGRLPIKAVAAECGFADQAHLTRQFAAHCGQTPAAFRRQAL